MEELLKCGDFVGKLVGREESASGEALVYLHRAASVKVGASHYWVNDYRIAAERHCVRADPSEIS